MGSLVGAVAGSLLFGLVTAFSTTYLPVIGPGLLHAVLARAHVRADGPRARLPPARAVRESRDDASRAARRSSSAGSASPCSSSRSSPRSSSRGFWMDAILTPDVHSRHRRGEPRLPLRLRRHDLARAGRADGHRRAMRSATWSPSASRAARRKGSSSAGTRRSRVVAAILLTVGIGILFGAVASRSFGIYFLMLTLTYAVIAFLFVEPGDARSAGSRRIARHRPLHAGVHRRRRQRPSTPLLRRARRRARRLRADPLPRADAVRDRARGDPRRARCAWPRSATTSRSTAPWPSASAR